MKIVLFLGAGASVPFGKPTTAQLRDKLKNEFQGMADPIFLPRFLDYEAYPDIEYVLQSTEILENF